MITITCTNCQATLTMDEAFAGGVCRCQHCGTIQTVPKSAKHGVASGTAPTAAKALWKQKTSSDTTAGTGLDELADIVASSGLAGSGLQSGGLRKRPAGGPAAAPARNKKLMPILAGAGAAIALGLIVLIWFLIKGPDPAGTARGTGPTAGGGDTPAVTVAGPGFAKVKLDKANTVAYVLDRGSGTANVFGDLRNLTLRSIASLGAERKFQIVFWQVREQVIAYPENGVTTAGETSVGEASRKLEDVNAFGSSNAGPALKKAAASGPDVIILATGKGADLTDDFVKDVKANRPNGVKIHTFNLGGDEAPLLKAIASETGGEYHVLTTKELDALRN
jgi:hypothetical protein